MSRGKFLWIGILVLVVTLVVGYFYFASTGGNALSRVTWNYFIKDLPDKKYSWRDFTDRGVDQGISGFYAYSDQDGFSMWTLSGLKTFTHVPGISVYMYEDICGAVRQLEENPQSTGSAVKARKEVTGDIGLWENAIKQENLVTVVRLPKREHHNGIDKVWSYSGIYKELNKLDRDSCK
jgi:hypothetical protein